MKQSANMERLAEGILCLLLALAVFGVTAMNLWPVIGYGLLALALLLLLRAAVPWQPATRVSPDRSVH